MNDTLEREDANVLRDVEQELRWDTRVNLTGLHVTVAAGLVTLSGDVDTWARRHAARCATLRVRGVLAVADTLHVRLPGSLERTDVQIREAVLRALEWDVRVPHARAEVSVSRGVVTLVGDVDHYSQRDDAEKAVRYLAGITGVQNLLSISPPFAETADVRGAVARVLERQCCRDVGRIDVVVTHGRVSLGGAVRSWPERRAVLGAACAMPGVRSVDDRMHVG